MDTSIPCELEETGDDEHVNPPNRRVRRVPSIHSGPGRVHRRRTVQVHYIPPSLEHGETVPAAADDERTRHDRYLLQDFRHMAELDHRRERREAARRRETDLRRANNGNGSIGSRQVSGPVLSASTVETAGMMSPVDVRESDTEADLTNMQRFIERMARREDIPDEWWAAAGLSRSVRENS